jgi:hypothetical protein
MISVDFATFRLSGVYMPNLSAQDRNVTRRAK